MSDVAVNTFGANKVMPYERPELAISRLVNLVPGVTYTRGAILGQVAASANCVQTLTVTGTPTGGTVALTGTNPLNGQAFTTGTIAYNASAATAAAAVQAALIAAGAPGAVVTGGGGAWPGSAITLTFNGSLAGMPVPLVALGTNALTGGSSPTMTPTMTTAGRTAGQFGVYADTGTYDPARAILPYACVTDSSGKISLSDANTGGVWGEKLDAIDVWVGGIFKTTDLSGLDAAAVADMNGALISGSASDGVLKF